MTIRISTFILIVFLQYHCTTSRVLTPDPLPMASNDADTLEIRDLDTLVVKADATDEAKTLVDEQPIYRSTAARSFDLLHTRLDLRFDWEQERVFGNAVLKLSPYFYPDSTLILDAKDFEIKKISIVGSPTNINYSYDGSLLTINLGRSFHRQDSFQIEIDYTANPKKGDEGSAAITSDQGLFFINPRGKDGSKPQQIWTQGETEFNSRWFPTIDKPNERCTHETYLTVEDRFVTLSNGLLKSSTKNNDGTRTDYWVMDMPHAPYLFMIAIGEFAKVTDTWRGKEVSYYVEPKYREYARDIFAHTPEMLTFFSEKIGIEYPWSKFSQIVVRDYVSGAMENTTAVIFGEFVQKNRRQLIDNYNDGIVAHELFHHWFGDYVTCESWSNLTLNEGFANYAEYLWLEHKYGRDEAENHRQQEFQGYLYQASQETHPLIDFGYVDKENMFDAHSYNKGGLVLHMLRNLVGDEAFFASLNHYLQLHALSSVEVHDLRLAFEEVTGLDLNWFFNQWYLSEGHPVLAFDYTWNASDQSVTLRINQTQEPNFPLFVLPTTVEIYYPGDRKERVEVLIDSRNEEIVLDLQEEPLVIVLDPERHLLAIINEQYSIGQSQLLYDSKNTLSLRTLALSNLSSEKTVDAQRVILNATNDPFWGVRQTAINAYDWESDPEKHPLLVTIAEKDQHSLVKADAIYILGNLGEPQFIESIAKGINEYEPYPVVAASILALHQTDPQMALGKLDVLQHEEQSEIVVAISTIYSESGDTSKLDYFEKHLATVEGLPSLDFFEALEGLLKLTQADTKMIWMTKFENVATGGGGISPYTKIAATRSMISLLKSAEGRRELLSEDQLNLLRQKIERIIDQEDNPQIVSIYQNFMNS